MKRQFITYSLLAVVALTVSLLLACFLEFGNLINPKFIREGGKLRNAAQEAFQRSTDPEILEQIPIGDNLVVDLPEDLLREMWFTPLMLEGATDSWGNPYRIVSATRDGARWFGLYSVGIDGNSATSGNDPDDINSWSKNGFDYYRKVIARKRRIRTIKYSASIFLLVAPVCFLIYQCRLRARELKEHPTANNLEH